MSEGMPGLFSRTGLPDDIWDRLEALEKRTRKIEVSHPGIPGVYEGQLAYWDFGGELVRSSAAGNEGVSVPVGGIILWSGSVASIPSGWALCDGSSGTPDLRGRFVVGAGGAHSPDDTGGADSVDISHTHTSGTYATDSDGHTHDVTGTSATGDSDHVHTSGSFAAASDAHTHTIAGNTRASAAGAVFYSTATTTGSDAHTHDVSGSSGSAGSEHAHTSGTFATDSDSHTHDVTGTSASGGDTTHDNRPAFYALAYIQRTG